MYDKILESVSTDLDDIYELNEAKGHGKPVKNLFGLSFEDYDSWLELSRDMAFDNCHPSYICIRLFYRRPHRI